MPSIVGSSIVQKYRDLGDILVFTFVKGNGTPERFGVDKEIFLFITLCETFNYNEAFKCYLALSF